ncbi:Protein SICKLE [Linum grandiflorum]
MEENSESRSDRLKAMRAITADASVGLPAPPGLLANPMLDGPSETETTAGRGGGPRFDFYTDPMAAFSSTRNRNPPLCNSPTGNFIRPAGRGPPPPAWVPPSPPPGQPWNPTPTSTPPYMQGHRPVNQGMYQANSPYGGGGSPYGSQGGIRSPFPFQQGSPRPQAWSEFADPAANYGCHPRGVIPRYHGSPNYAPARSPSVNHGQGNPTWVGNAHRPNSGYGGHQFPGSGRGQGGRWHRGSGRGRGRGFQNRDSTSSERQDPWRFYHDSMVEDPWKGLRPIEWRGITAGSSGSWMPSSLSAKRPRGPVSSFNQSSDSGQSLADYLASSFNEASNAEQNT